MMPVSGLRPSKKRIFLKEGEERFSHNNAVCDSGITMYFLIQDCLKISCIVFSIAYLNVTEKYTIE
jgi:hypothetical protein